MSVAPSAADLVSQVALTSSGLTSSRKYVTSVEPTQLATLRWPNVGTTPLRPCQPLPTLAQRQLASSVALWITLFSE